MLCDAKGPNTGAIISLNALGKQDRYLLTDEPEHSLFKYKINKHSNFSKYHRNTTVHKPAITNNTSWPFGETIKITMNPRNMGDLLSNMYIMLDLPGVSSGSYNYADQIGRHLFKSITMRVDELVIEKYHDDWGIIYDNLYLDESEKRTKRYTLNRNLAENTSVPEIGGIGNKAIAQYKSKVFVPIPLLFSRKYESDEYYTNKPNRPYFPTCAMHKQKLEFEIEFNPQTFFTDDPNPIPINSFDIITEEITVSKNERIYLMNEPQVLITDIVKKHPTEDSEIGKDLMKIQLVPEIPVKTIYWFLRDKRYEDKENARGGDGDPNNNDDNRTYLFHNRYNFSKTNLWTVQNAFFNPIMKEAKLFVNGEDLPNIPTIKHEYYKYVVPFTHRLSRPERNIYSYSFSMNPINVEPSGSLDFGQLQSNKTLMEIKLMPNLTDIYVFNAYYVGYQTFKFENGYISLAY